MSNLFKLGAFGVIVLLLIIGSFFIVEDVPADKIVVNQVPISGNLQFWTTPGWKAQMFGHTTEYPKSYQIWFSTKEDQGDDYDDAIKVVFNDGGEGYISGSIRIILPLDDKHLRAIHYYFGSTRNLIHELIKPTVTKVVFNTGPLMSSYESYAAKRTDFIRYIEDQLRHGVYKTNSRQMRVLDEFTGKEKVVTLAELVNDPKSPGGLMRQEEAPFEKFNIRVAAVSIESVTYGKTIQDQINQQQKAQMEVQTAIAETKKQEQQLIQEQKRGEKEAVVAKWEQEKIKAKEITLAEQKREVARLDMEAAEFNRLKNIKDGQGEAEKKRLIMNADGQLTAKLDTWLKAQDMWAKAFQNYGGNLVPTTLIGTTPGGHNSLTTFMDMMMMKTAQDLNFSPKVTK